MFGTYPIQVILNQLSSVYPSVGLEGTITFEASNRLISILPYGNIFSTFLHVRRWFMSELSFKSSICLYGFAQTNFAEIGHKFQNMSFKKRRFVYLHLIENQPCQRTINSISNFQFQIFKNVSINYMQVLSYCWNDLCRICNSVFSWPETVSVLWKWVFLLIRNISEKWDLGCVPLPRITFIFMLCMYVCYLYVRLSICICDQRKCHKYRGKNCLVINFLTK